MTHARTSGRSPIDTFKAQRILPLLMRRYQLTRDAASQAEILAQHFGYRPDDSVVAEPYIDVLRRLNRHAQAEAVEREHGRAPLRHRPAGRSGGVRTRSIPRHAPCPSADRARDPAARRRSLQLDDGCADQSLRRVVPDGFVIIDDYGLVIDARRATLDFRASRGITDQMIAIDGVFWRKRPGTETGPQIPS